MKNKVMRGYKALNKDMSSAYGDMKYEIGKQYQLEGNLKLCKNGYHFCENMIDVSRFYGIDNSRVFEIEARGNILNGEDKSCTNNIRLVRELSEKEIETTVNECYDNEDAYIRKIIAKSKYTNNETLEKLSNDDDWDVRYGVAGNSNTDVKTLEKLSNDTDFNIRCAVAKNINTDVKMFDKLSNDDSWWVRRAVAQNPNTSIGILNKLSNDTDVDIRFAVAENPNTDMEALKRLRVDEDSDICCVANENLNEIFLQKNKRQP